MFRHRQVEQSPVEIVFDVLATYRLTKLIIDDKVTEDLREWVWAKYGQPDDEDSSKISYFITCPWCLSIYFGTGVAAARIMFPKTWSLAARALSFSALTGMIVERED